MRLRRNNVIYMDKSLFFGEVFLLLREASSLPLTTLLVKSTFIRRSS